MRKRIISLFLAAVLAFSVLQAVPELNVSGAVEIDYTCGENATWSLDVEKCELVISGTGATKDYLRYAPWYDYGQYVKTVVVEEGITVLGESLFSYCGKINEISLPSTLLRVNTKAFRNTESLKSVKFPNGCNLVMAENEIFVGSSYPRYQGNGPYYLGTVCCGYYGTMPENASIKIKDGTLGIAYCAFDGMTQLTSVEFPDSLIAIAEFAFRDTAWDDNLPDGLIYAGNVVYDYRGLGKMGESLTLRDGTTGIASRAFQGCDLLSELIMPSTVEYVGRYAFIYTDVLYNIEISPSLKYIYDSGFANCEMKKAVIPSTVKYVGTGAFQQCSLLETVEFEDSYSLDEIVYYMFYGCTRLSDIEIPACTKEIASSVFWECWSIKEITIPKSVEKIGGGNFKYTNGQNSMTISCYKDSYAHTYALENGFDYILIDGNQETEVSEINSWLDTAESINRDLYTEETLSALDDAVKAVNLDSDGLTQEQIDEWTEKIKKAFDALAYKKADYSAVEKALSKVNVTDRSLYTNESLEKLDAAVSSVDYSVTVERQSSVDEYAETIEKAIAALEYKKADYSAVNDALAKANAIDRSVYTAESLAKLDTAIDSVEENLDITNQTKVSSYALAINDALALLKFRPANFSRLDNAVMNAEMVNRNLYTPESLAKLDVALAKINRNATVNEQSAVDALAVEIENAIKALEYAAADLSVVSGLIAKADKIDRSVYTAESLAVLDKAVAQVDYNITKEHQTKVAVWAKSIDDALKNLKYKPADYSKVNAAVSNAKKLDKLLYTSSTYTAVEQSVAAVDYSLDITRQAEVDAFAKKINESISALAYAEVVLRNEPNGVIVSATSKEIYPTTELTVDKIDPSGYEVADFAVGGHIKSVNYYDINLLRNSQKIQPNGTVYVKIKIPEGVTPEKCRVYHVTKDPVDPLVRFSSTLDGNYIVFETDHFSEFAVIEIETVLSEIKVTKLPLKTVYTAGEKLNTDGMTVTAVMSDGTEVNVENYDISDTDMSVPGKKTVTVYCTVDGVTKSVSFEITVNVAVPESTAKPEPSTKPTEPSIKPITPPVTDTKATLEIRKPSQTEIKYGDSIILHADVAKLPEGAKIVWSTDNGNFTYIASADGTTCTVSPSENGDTVFTATVVDVNGNEIVNDTQTMTSKAGFFRKIIAFFKKLFGLTKIIPEKAYF